MSISTVSTIFLQEFADLNIMIVTLSVLPPAEACEQVCWCYLISFLSRHLGVFLTGCDERRADLTSSLYTLCLTTRQSQVVEPMKHSVAKITN